MVADEGQFQESDGSDTDESDGGRYMPVSRGAPEKIPNVSPTVSYCISKAMSLARQLNHPETTVAHFIVAMVLQSEAPEWFKRRHFDVQSAWRSAMGHLIDLKRVNIPLDSTPPPSSELKTIINE